MEREAPRGSRCMRGSAVVDDGERLQSQAASLGATRRMCELMLFRLTEAIRRARTALRPEDAHQTSTLLLGTRRALHLLALPG